MSDEVSYTANIKVDRVKRERQTSTYGMANAPSGGDKRIVESFRLTVRAPTIEQLSQKIQAHMGLVDDDDFGADQQQR